MAIGTNLGLEENFLKQLLQLIHEESILRQTEIFNKGNKKKT
jgi:hypothetical protein